MSNYLVFLTAPNYAYQVRPITGLSLRELTLGFARVYMSKKALTFKAPKAEAPKAPAVKPIAPKAKAITKAKEAPKAPPKPTPIPTPTPIAATKAERRALRTPEENQVLTNAALKAWATRRAKADAAKAEADAKAKAEADAKAKAPKKGRKSA